MSIFSSVEAGEENVRGSKIFACASIKGGLFIFLLYAKRFYRCDLNLVYNSFAKNFFLEKKKEFVMYQILNKHPFNATNTEYWGGTY